MASASTTEYLHLIIYPDITGVYQREIRLALISGENNNMVRIDNGVKAIATMLTRLSNSLSAVATSGNYTDLENKPNIAASVPLATVVTPGKVIPDGDTILIDENGIIRAAARVAVATTQAAGIVKPDGVTITVENDGTISARDTYTKEQVDSMLERLSNIFITNTDKSAMYSKMNSFMGTSYSYTGLGANILVIDNKAQTLIN